MSNEFNLLSLHYPTDRHPRTWVAISGKKMKTLIREMENDVLKKQELTRESLSRELGQKFFCANGVIKRILQGKSQFFPIPIILELAKRSHRKKIILSKIKNDIESLKINSASAKPVRAVRKLTQNLAKIIGAFMADGSLSVQVIFAAPTKEELVKTKREILQLKIKSSFGYSKTRKEHYISLQINTENIKTIQKLQGISSLQMQAHYNIELTEEYRDSVEAFNKWMKETFGVEPTNFQKKKNAWRTIFSNKIIARFLMQFFEVIPGPKTYTAYEPGRIQKASLIMRKNFARGVLMFDGCVTKSGKITFSSKSKVLTSAIEKIWTKDKIAHGKIKKNNRGEWIIFSTSKNKMTKLLDYFEQNTQKRKLLYWINGNRYAKPIIKSNMNLSAEKILSLLKKIKSCDINYLERHFNRRYTSIRHYLNILKKQKKISVSTKPRIWTHYISEKATVMLAKSANDTFFTKIKEKLNLGKNAASLLGIHKATFSAWKLQKNRIRVKSLRQLCSVLDLNFEDIAKATVKIDRDVIELI